MCTNSGVVARCAAGVHQVVVGAMGVKRCNSQAFLSDSLVHVCVLIYLHWLILCFYCTTCIL